MSSDREEMSSMSLDWTTPEYLANLAAEELGHALSMRGINFRTCFGDPDGLVSLSFNGMRDTETLLALAVPGPTGPGTLYDRATGGCVSLAALAESKGEDASEDEVESILDAGWAWLIHPDMRSHVVGWHITVVMPTADANTVTARLNALPFTDDTQ